MNCATPPASRNDAKTPLPVIVVALITALCLLGDSMLYVVLPVHFRAGGLDSLWQVGVLLSVNRLVRLPLNPLVGWLYTRLSLRGGILFASLLAAVTTLGYGYASSFGEWIVLRAVWGVSWTFLKLGAFFVILESAQPARRGQAMGVYNGLYRLGSLVGMFGGGLLADSFGLRATAVTFGLLSCLALIMAWRTLPARRGEQDLGSFNVDAGLLRDRALMWILGTGTLVALVYQGLLAATLSWLSEVHFGQVALLAGVSVGCASLAGGLQAVRWLWEPWLAPWFGRLCDRGVAPLAASSAPSAMPQGRRRVLAGGLLAAGLLFAAATLSLPLPLWILVLLGIQAAGTALTTVADVIAADAAAQRPERSGLLLSSYALLVDLGSAIGPLAAYGINALCGIDTAYILAGIGLFLLGLVWLRGNPAQPVQAAAATGKAR